MSSQPQKTQESPKCFKQIPVRRAFYADHFDKKGFLFSSKNDDARVKILKNVTSSSNLTLFSRARDKLPDPMT